MAQRAGLRGSCLEPVNCWWTTEATFILRTGHHVPVNKWTRNDLLRDLPHSH